MNSSGPSVSSGKGWVEVCYNNSYWTICEDDWNNIAAGVVCRQLGYPFSSIISIFLIMIVILQLKLCCDL